MVVRPDRGGAEAPPEGRGLVLRLSIFSDMMSLVASLYAIDAASERHRRSPRRMFGVGDRVSGKACGNCPTNGCLGCPLATEYPEFSKIRARRDRKRRNLIKQRKDEAAERLGLAAEGREL